jgi:hypothetical protein
MDLKQNKVEILEVSRPNPNPKNIEGRATLNGYKVCFSIMEEPNGHIRPKWVIFPENVDWNRIIKGSSSTGHAYYANIAIIKKLKQDGLIK